MLVRGYRQQLRTAVAASAAPYGYTLTVWTAGAVTSHAEQAFPSPIDALLLLTGAVLGYGLAGTIACRGPNGVVVPGVRNGMRIWGGWHLPSVGASILLVSLVTKVVHGHAVWPLAGFVATATYLFVIAIQFVVATRSVDADAVVAPDEQPLR